MRVRWISFFTISVTAVGKYEFDFPLERIFEAAVGQHARALHGGQDRTTGRLVAVATPDQAGRNHLAAGYLHHANRAAQPRLGRRWPQPVVGHHGGDRRHVLLPQSGLLTGAEGALLLRRLLALQRLALLARLVLDLPLALRFELLEPLFLELAIAFGLFALAADFIQLLLLPQMIRKKLPDIVKGVYYSMIKRVLEMDALTEKVVMTGGVVAHNPFMVKMTEEMIDRKILVPDYPQLTGAIGAALYAIEADI
mgnify:CR=1 FL=1